MFEEMLNGIIAQHGQLGLFCVMIIQTIIAPIPSEAIPVFAVIIGMSMVDVVLFGGSGLIIGSIIGFFIARYVGKPLVTLLVGEQWIGDVDKWIEKKGMKFILATRLIPIIPFDLVSYMTGLTKMKFRGYLIATTLGAFPRTLFLALMGLFASGVLKWIGISMDAIIIIAFVGSIVYVFADRKGWINRLRLILIDLLRKKEA